MFPTVAWLLLLVAPGSPWAAGQVFGENQNEHPSKCYQSLSGEARALNLGQKWEDPNPTATMLLDLQAVTSASSFFDFRTFDPEGLIFYGDTNPGVDWFILALRRGKLEMQIHNNVTRITASGGMRLNDGRWHRILVKNEGHRVLLELDGEEYLVLNHVSHPIVNMSLMHIGVGGLLIPTQELLIPLNTAMDGCIRHWNWLNKSSEWREAASLRVKGTKGCFPTIQPGSFFPGDGLATFSLSDLPRGLSSASGNWTLTVEMWINAALQSGTLFAVSASGQTPVLRLSLQQMDVVIQLGSFLVVLPMPPGRYCLDWHLHLIIAQSRLRIQLGDDVISMPPNQEGFQSLKTLWLDKKGAFVIGGLPGPDQDGDFFHGCLREIKVQGQKLDLDAVQSRSNSIWAHSCPGGDGGRHSAGI